jgi:hypothetical protein
MGLKILLCIIVLALVLDQGTSSNGTEWYRNEMIAKVVPHYNAAYRILNKDIIERILCFNASVDGEKSVNTSKIYPEQNVDNETVYEEQEFNENYGEGITDESVMIEQASEEVTTIEQTTVDTTTIRTVSDDTAINLEETSQQTMLLAPMDDEYPEDYVDGNEKMKGTQVTDNRVVQDSADDENTDSNESDDDTVNETTTTIEYVDSEEETNNTEITNVTPIFTHVTDETTTMEEVVETTDEQSQLGNLLSDIQIAANSVHRHLKNASTECERLRVQMDEQIESAVIAISLLEEDLRQRQRAIDTLKAEIRYHEHVVALAQQVVHQRQIAVENAEHQLREANARVGRARGCRNKRRRKRFLGGWWYDNVEKPVVEAFCSVVNMNGIEIAKDARVLAGNTLNDAQQRLATQQRELSEKKHQLFWAQFRRGLEYKRKEDLDMSHSNTQSKYKVLSSLTKQFKDIETYLTEVLKPSQRLKKVVKHLINFKLVINPLNILAQQMINEQLLTSFGTEISASTITNVDRILDQLSAKLARLPLFIGESKSSLEYVHE